MSMLKDAAAKTAPSNPGGLLSAVGAGRVGGGNDANELSRLLEELTVTAYRVRNAAEGVHGNISGVWNAESGAGDTMDHPSGMLPRTVHVLRQVLGLLFNAEHNLSSTLDIVNPPPLPAGANAVSRG